MSHLKITGGIPLHGRVRAAGAKNAALPIMAASILASGPVRLMRVPQVEDVRTLSAVLDELGLNVSRNNDGDLLFETVDDSPHRARYGLLSRMRAGFCVLGPLLAKRGKAVVAMPGGCNIGDRPVDVHLKGLATLGADLHFEHGYVIAEAERLRGTTVDMAGACGPTVTGTANVLSAAVLAEGTTIIQNAAVEPEVEDLGKFLVALGAKVEGLGTKTIRVEGVDKLGDATYEIIPDRIEAATLLLAGAITGGQVTVEDVIPRHLENILAELEAAGLLIDRGSESVSLRRNGRMSPLDITALPYPSMPTDLQPQLTALLSLVPGESTVTDRVFPNRFMHLAELKRLGARIERQGSSVLIRGVDKLTGAGVAATDLRAAAALVIAGLAADGQTIVRHCRHLDRGYDGLEDKLKTLGAKIERCEK